jgi:hypothetical protein
MSRRVPRAGAIPAALRTVLAWTLALALPGIALAQASTQTSVQASAQGPTQAHTQASAPDCVRGIDLLPVHLYGLWRAEFDAGLPPATLLFERHPELAGSVRGGINRGGAQAQVAGDVDDGQFTLEESEDGRHISATWVGQVVDTSCGKEIRGTWTNARDNRGIPFVLRKVPGWQ